MTARVLLASALPLLLTISPGCVRSHSCTAIGCSDQATISIHRADWTALSLTVELDIDGRKLVCAAPGPQQVAAPCDTNVSLEARQLSDCHDTSTAGARSQTCTPNDRFEEVITIRGTPTTVGVTLKSAGAVVAERAFQLTYRSSRPNGPDCDPLCRQSTQTWELGGPGLDAGGSGDTAEAPPDAARDASTDATADAPNDARPDTSPSLDAPPDGAPTDSLDGGPTCGTTTCAAGEVCVRVQTIGGACFMPGDAGCPPGFSPGGFCCEPDPTFHCATRPAACGSTLTCACASSLCSPGRNCATPTTTEIDCTLLAP